jgi:O-antigen/teichoic acid export membrane protein
MNVGTRVVFNTAVLYIRLFIAFGIGLFTTRLVLAALGEIDYGIYALVGGVVAMLGILNSSMSNASMRFMAHSLGTGDQEIIRKTFNTTLLLHFVIGIFVIILMEAGGWFIFNYLLNLPEAKISDAWMVFHFMVITTFISIISVPYDAVMNAHENILALSLVDLLGYVLKLAIAIFLTYSDGNLLVLYSFFIMLTHFVLRIIKQLYSSKKYSECRLLLRTGFDSDLSFSILSFTGWNLLGSIAAMSVGQVRSILLNMFFGVTVNAADGISKTATAQVNMVSVNMTRALNPQLVKSEGSGNRERMLRFTELATKYSIFLFALIAIPVALEANYLINSWLKDVPEYTSIFFQLVLLSLFIDKFTFEIGTAIRAVGIIRNFQIAEMTPLLFSIPIGYFVFRLGYPPYTIFAVTIVLGCVSGIVRLYYGKVIASMSLISFFNNGILPVLLPLFLSISISLLVITTMEEGIVRLIVTVFTSFIVILISFWFLGINKDETVRLKAIFSYLTKFLN